MSLTALVLVFCLIGEDPNTPTQAGVRMDLPYRVGDFWGFAADVTKEEKFILPGDTEFARQIYQSTTGDEVNCQIVLSGGQKRSIHRPEVCLRGQGWDISTGDVVPVKLASGRILKVMKLNISRPVEVAKKQSRTLRMEFYYWFVGKDITTPYHHERVLITSQDRILHNLNHRWAYVIVSSPVTGDFAKNGKTIEQTDLMLENFIREVAPKIQKTGA
jgi:EpsI family protein